MIVIFFAAALLIGCIQQEPISTPTPTSSQTPTPPSTVYHTPYPDVYIFGTSCPPLIRGNSSILNFTIVGKNVTSDTKILLDYSIEVWYPDGTRYPLTNKSKPEGINVTFESKSIVFPRSVTWGEPAIKFNSSATVTIDPTAPDGDYYLTIYLISNKDIVTGSTTIAFKLGKGGKMPEIPTATPIS
jgi:hypothetical protein